MSPRSLPYFRKAAAVLMLIISVQLVYYLYRSLWRAWRFCFGEPERWETHWRVDPATVIEFSGRLNYFVAWVVVILASAVAMVAALALLNHIRKGQIFSHRTAILIRRLGLILTAAMVMDIIFQAADAWFLTRYNFVREPLAFVYDPSDLKTACLAVILFLFGWVMAEATRIDAENKGFV